MYKRYRIKQKKSLERRLEIAQTRLAHYEEQKAGFGDLYVPAYIQIEIEKEKKKIASLKNQLTRIEKSHALYGISQRLKLLTRSIGDIFVPYDSASKRRRTKMLSKLRTRAGWAAFIFCILLMFYFNSRGVLSFNLSPGAVPLSIPLNTPSPYTSTIYPTLTSIQSTEAQSNTPSVMAVIANTGGKGVRFRLEPKQEAPSNFSINEGTTVFLLGDITNEIGELWWKVQLNDGQIGYVWEGYILLK